jgi:2-dehydro-3-deoxygluconokinase
MKKASVAVIGECMLEMSLASGGCELDKSSLPANLSFGGDVLNTAVYLSRLKVGVDFVTAVGDDTLSDWLVKQWQLEGVGCERVARLANDSPGLYMIATDSEGERSFSYWRDSSPARKILDDEVQASRLFAELLEYPWLYFTGISLAILPPAARASLLGFLDSYRSAGGKVAFDSNFRPRLWADVDEAKAVFNQVYQRCDLALLTLDDETALFGEGSLDSHISRLRGAGIDELVLKLGAEGCAVVTDEASLTIPAIRVQAVDTTSAGDSFNAGYLAKRIADCDVTTAAKFAHSLAALVIQHPGAIVPHKVTATLGEAN